MEKVRDCWANKRATRITLKLSTATREGGRVTKIDRGPGVPIIKMTTAKFIVEGRNALQPLQECAFRGNKHRLYKITAVS